MPSPTRPRPRRRPSALVLTGALVLAGCSDGPQTVGQAVTPSQSPAPAAPSATPPPTSEAPPPAPTPTTVDPSPTRPTGVPAGTTTLVDGLDLPWSAAPHPDGGWLVSQRDDGTVTHVRPDGTTSPVLATGPGGVVPAVAHGGEGGLLGLLVLAEDPGDGSGPWLYAYHTTDEGGRSNRVVRMPLDVAAATLGEPQVVLAGIPAASNHNGGRLALGPDGHLYVTTGDAGRTELSQDLQSLGGKVLRVTTSGAVPADNPFPGSPVWTYGHRNVQGIGWDSAGRAYASEFGQNALDELNVLVPGANYGWPQVEGAGGAEGFVDPVATWSTDEASPSGLAVTGDAVYLAALRGQRLWRVPLDPATGDLGPPEDHLRGELGRVRDVVVTADGDLLVLTSNGGTDVVARVALG